MAYCIINGRLLPEKEAAIPIQDRGFRFGDGVFETIAVAGGVPYQFDWHMERLDKGLRAIKIAFDPKLVQDYCRLLLRENRCREGLLRVQVTRGIGGRGYLPDPKALPTLVIETLPAPNFSRDPVRLWLSAYRKISPRALPVRYKLCQGLNSILARMEAAEQDCFDALLLNDAGHVCETSSGNIFWLKEGALCTPSLACGVLEGSTRAAVMRLSPHPAVEVEAGMEALRAAEAVCIANAAWKILPAGHLLPEGLTWQSEALAEALRRALDSDREEHGRSYRGNWVSA